MQVARPQIGQKLFSAWICTCTLGHISVNLGSRGISHRDASDGSTLTTSGDAWSDTSSASVTEICCSPPVRPPTSAVPAASAPARAPAARTAARPAPSPMP